MSVATVTNIRYALRLPLPPAARTRGRPGWEVVCGEGEAGQRLLHRPVGNVKSLDFVLKLVTHNK